MKPVYALGTGVAFSLIAVATWVGCSSNSGGGSDGGTDSATSSSSSSGGSSSSSSSSGGSSSSSSSSGGSSSSSSSGGGGVDAGHGADAGHAADAGDAGNASDAQAADGGDGGTITFGDGGTLTWAQVYSDVISGHCAGCHSAPPPDAGGHGGFLVGHLDMSTVDAGYMNLIDQPAQGTQSFSDAAPACDTLADASVSGSVRVVPNDAGASLLFRKVHGFDMPPPCGSPMPINGEIPDGGQQAAAAEIMQWISQGAHP